MGEEDKMKGWREDTESRTGGRKKWKVEERTLWRCGELEKEEDRMEG